MSLTAESSEKLRELRQSRQMNSAMQDGLHRQLKAEFEAAYFYLGVATYFSQMSLDGIAHWFQKQSEEEMTHAMKIYQFMRDRGVDITLPGIEAPETRYQSPIEAFECSLDHERHVSVMIHDLYAQSQKLEEYDTGAFVLWFLNEQVEEENVFDGLVSKLKMANEGNALTFTLLMMDKDLGERTEA